MSTLVVVAYPNEFQAEEVRLRLLKMHQEYLVDLEDAVIAVRKEDGKIKLLQLHNLTGAGAVSGGFWGLLIGLLFMNPLLGAAVGALLNIDGAIHRLGTWVETHVHRHEGGPSLAEGFVTASLLCCVGAMAVNGSLDAGIRGDNSILLTKSMIDLVFCAMLATTLGAGVMLAGAAVFVVEGALTLLAGAIAPLLSEAAVADLTCAGSLLVAAIGLNQTGATKIKVADYLPALLFVPLIRWLVSLPVWQQIAAWF